MSGRDDVAERIERERLLLILRVADARSVPEILAGAADAGLGLAEISFSSDAGRVAVSRSAAAPPPGITLGAGTVRTVADAEDAVAAGARFLVAPSFSAAVNEFAARAGVLYLPGVMTPTEVDAALQSGIRLLKLFPAGRLGPDYVRDLLGPFPEARLVATGGVDAGNAASFLAAGAAAVAMGGSLVPAGAASSRTAVAERIRHARHVIARSSPHEENHVR